MKHLLLIGGGHAHLTVLQALARQSFWDVQVTLVTPESYQTCSNRVSAWLAGHHPLSECQIDLRPLAEAAGAGLLIDRVVGMNANTQQVILANQPKLSYDLISINLDSESRLNSLLGCEDDLVASRPSEHLVSAWPKILHHAQKQKDYAIAVVGAGLLGVELAFSINYAFKQHGLNAKVHLVGPSLLKGHVNGLVERTQQLLAKVGIRYHKAMAEGVPNGLHLSNGDWLAADKVIAATGAKSLSWLASTELDLTQQAYIAVNEFHQSRSHPNVFATGDIGKRLDQYPMQLTLNDTVQAGEILAHNLLAVLQGKSLMSYTPKNRSLYLMTTGDKYGIASYRGWSLAGSWAWHLKQSLDSRLIRCHSRMRVRRAEAASL